MMKRMIAVLALAVSAVCGLGVAQPVWADSDVCHDKDISDELKEAAGCNTTTKADTFIGNLLNVVLGLVGLVAIGAIIYGGFTYTTSAGDTGKVQKGKSILIYGVIGLIVALLAFAIVRFVGTSIGG